MLVDLMLWDRLSFALNRFSYLVLKEKLKSVQLLTDVYRTQFNNHIQAADRKSVV